MIRKHVIVSGHVQGVFFRDSCRRAAREHGVTGWVRNRPDGTVEAVFEGEPPAVDAMVAWAGRGPRLAHVHRIDVEEEPPENLKEFVVC